MIRSREKLMAALACLLLIGRNCVSGINCLEGWKVGGEIVKGLEHMFPKSKPCEEGQVCVRMEVDEMTAKFGDPSKQPRQLVF